MVSGVIYVAICTNTNKSYIGLTAQSLSLRMTKHKRRVITVIENNHFHKAIIKYGWEILNGAYCIKMPEEQLGLAEICAIHTHDTYCSGYNSTIGGDESPMKNSHTAQKVSKSLKGRFRGFGKENNFYGKKHSEEAKRLITKAGCKYTWETIRPDKTVEIITNLMEYCRKNKLVNSNMYAVAGGKRKIHKGYSCRKIGEL